MLQQKPVEQAILYLAGRCDGAIKKDDMGFNATDTKIGHSIADQIAAGRSLSQKQRRLVRILVTKYHGQLRNWEELMGFLDSWVAEAPEVKAKEIEKLPRLDYSPDENKFFLYTRIEHRDLAKSLGRAFWIPEQRVWRYLNTEENAESFLKAKDQIAETTPAAQKALDVHRITMEEFERAKAIVDEAKRGAEGSHRMPLKYTTKPYTHQRQAFDIATAINAAGLLMEQGTGKTLPAIATIGHRYNYGQINRVLLIGKLTVLSEWKRQFKEFADYPLRFEILSQELDERKVALKEWQDTPAMLSIIATNFEATWRMEDELISWLGKKGMVIIDESQKIKNGMAKQSKTAHKLGDLTPYKLILTGTPYTQGPLDIFSQYRFLNKRVFGTSFRKFRDRYAVMGGYGGYKVIAYRILPTMRTDKGREVANPYYSKELEEEYARKVHSIAFRVTKDECLDLPEAVDQNLYCELEPDAQKIYDQMLEDALVKIGDDEVTAPIILTQLLRLQQISGGFLPKLDKYEDTKVAAHQVSSAKLDALMETVVDLIDSGKKIVIFARFLPEISAISSKLEEEGIEHVGITGKSSQKQREISINDFQTRPEIDVFLTQIATGGIGITLTAADTAIFYSWDYSLESYEQAKARIHRIGQTKKVTYIHIIAESTTDQDVLQILQNKKDVAKLVTDDMKNIFRRNVKGATIQLRLDKGKEVSRESTAKGSGRTGTDIKKYLATKAMETLNARKEKEEVSIGRITDPEAMAAVEKHYSNLGDGLGDFEADDLDAMLDKVIEDLETSGKKKADKASSSSSLSKPSVKVSSQERPKKAVPSKKVEDPRKPLEKEARVEPKTPQKAVEKSGSGIEAKVPTSSHKIITAKELALMVGTDAKSLRVWLRSHKGRLEEGIGRWEWASDDPIIEEVKRRFAKKK